MEVFHSDTFKMKYIIFKGQYWKVSFSTWHMTFLWDKADILKCSFHWRYIKNGFKD